MSTTRPLLISISFVVSAPADDEALEPFLGTLSDRLEQQIRPAVEDKIPVESFEGFAYHYLGDSDENAARCASCGRWTTDVDRPRPIHALMMGTVVSGKLICDECQFFGDDSPQVCGEP